jgi:hypothetical protein
MPSVRSRCDSLALFLTGATADGGAQANPNLALGHFRSSTRGGGLGFYLKTAIAGITIDFVSAANGIGPASLHVAGPDSLNWSPPGNTAPGQAVTILAGNSAIVEGPTPDQYCSVTRTSPDPLAGSALLELRDVFNEVIGQADGTLPQGKTYRCICLKNGGTQTLKNVLIWIAHQDNPIRIALELPSAQPSGFFQTIANETTSPAAVTFVSPTSSVDPHVISVAKMLPNEQIAIWIERDLTAAAANPQRKTELAWSFTAIG